MVAYTLLVGFLVLLRFLLWLLFSWFVYLVCLFEFLFCVFVVLVLGLDVTIVLFRLLITCFWLLVYWCVFFCFGVLFYYRICFTNVLHCGLFGFCVGLNVDCMLSLIWGVEVILWCGFICFYYLGFCFVWFICFGLFAIGMVCTLLIFVHLRLTIGVITLSLFVLFGLCSLLILFDFCFWLFYFNA